MKTVHEIVVCVCDYGSFLSLAEKLAETCAKVYYHSPCDQEFEDIRACVIGDGMEEIERLDDPLDPDVLDTIDLFVFPDIGFEGLQRHLRSLGKPVWGSFGGSELELYRTQFVKWIQKLGLPTVDNEVVTGLTALGNRLHRVRRKWIKIDRFRKNMETWFHLDYAHSVGRLSDLAVMFGGLKERVTFVIQDEIEATAEIGYDGWTIDGEFPESSFQGFEKKNELYLGTATQFDDLAEQVREVNHAIAPTLRKLGYRNFIATEIRVAGDVGYFIDPTMRMPGQTGEQLLETCANLADILWHGAQGEVVQPIWTKTFAAEATLHFKDWREEQWMAVRIPEAIRRFVKLYHCCSDRGVYHFPPHDTDEIGVILGIGNSVEAAITQLKVNLKGFGDEPVTAEVDGFGELLREVAKAQKAGMADAFGDLPEPAFALKPVRTTPGIDSRRAGALARALAIRTALRRAQR